MKAICLLLLSLLLGGCSEPERFVAEWSGDGSKNLDVGSGIEDGVSIFNDSTLFVYRCRRRNNVADTLFKSYFRFDPQQRWEAFNVAQLASGYEYLNPSARAEYHQQIHLLRPISRQEALR